MDPYSSPETLVRAYWNAASLKEGLAYVHKPDRVQSLMDQFYRYTVFPDTMRMRRTITSVEEIDKDKWYVVYARGVNEETSTYWVRREGGQCLIDFEASIGHNDLSWAEFVATHPTTPLTRRASAWLDDEFYFLPDVRTYSYYKYFGLSGLVWSVALEGEDPGGRTYRMHGFIPKDDPDGQRLFDVLRDGRNYQVVVDLAFPDWTNAGSKVVRILKFRKVGWNIDSL